MKPVNFRYCRPTTVQEAVELLAVDPEAKIMAGGQTLGPMLNLRLAQPSQVVDITRLSELAQVRDDEAAVTFGALVTHAAIEDGRTPDPTNGFMRRLAAGIGYRAVRVRGTIGGSLAHADPAADWMSALLLLGADVSLRGRAGVRSLPLARFMRGALDTALEPAELLTSVTVRKTSARARLGYYKVCRKEGEFADVIAGVLQDPERGIFRAVVSTPSGAPRLIERQQAFDDAEVGGLVDEMRLDCDAYDTRLRHVALRRAINEARP